MSPLPRGALVRVLVVLTLLAVQLGTVLPASALTALPTDVRQSSKSFDMDGTVDCTGGCTRTVLVNGVARTILTLLTESIGQPAKPVEVDVTGVLDDLPTIRQGRYLKLEVEATPEGRYLALTVQMELEGTESQGRATGSARPAEQPDRNEDEDDEKPTTPRPACRTVTLSLTGSPIAQSGGVATVTATPLGESRPYR